MQSAEYGISFQSNYFGAKYFLKIGGFILLLLFFFFYSLLFPSLYKFTSIQIMRKNEICLIGNKF